MGALQILHLSMWLGLLMPSIILDFAVRSMTKKASSPFDYTALSVYSNLLIFFSEIAGVVLFYAALAPVLVFLERHSFRFIHWSGGPLEIILAFVLLDLVFYVWHRLSHNHRFWWIAHQVHHQDGSLNLLTGSRSGLLEAIAIFPFYGVIIVFGIPAKIVFLVVSAINGFMYFSHSGFRRFPKPIELFFNTPANHRLHHAKGEMSGRCNYGGILVFWDILFGTYKTGGEPMEFGVRGMDPDLRPISDQLSGVSKIFSRPPALASYYLFGYFPLFAVLFILLFREKVMRSAIPSSGRVQGI